MNIFRRVWARLCRIFSGEPAPLRTVVVEDLPEQLRAGNVYLVGENGHFWCAALMCPCGCGVVILLNLVSTTRPVWTFELEYGAQTITLKPSVWRTAGCRSHFFLRSGRVQWCGASMARP